MIASSPDAAAVREAEKSAKQNDFDLESPFGPPVQMEVEFVEGVDGSDYWNREVRCEEEVE